MEPPVNSGESWPDFDEAASRVRWMQAKLHLWATRDPGRVFDDLYNLVYDPAFLVLSWERVQGNKGGRTAGVDGIVPINLPKVATRFLMGLRRELKERTFRPQPVREQLILKPGSTKKRRLGIPTAADPGGSGVAEAGAGADLRGGFCPGELRVPSSAARSGRDR